MGSDSFKDLNVSLPEAYGCLRRARIHGETKQHRLLVQDIKHLSRPVSTDSDGLESDPAQRRGLATKRGLSPGRQGHNRPHTRFASHPTSLPRPQQAANTPVGSFIFVSS